MRLFSRTLILFLGVIVIQSLLTFLLIDNVISTVNQKDAQDELYFEATTVDVRFHQAKRDMWNGLVRIKRSVLIREFLSTHPDAVMSIDFRKILREVLDSESIDWLRFRKYNNTNITQTEVSNLNRDIIAFDATIIPPQDFTFNTNYQQWPILRVTSQQGKSYLEGTLLLPGKGSEVWAIHAIRHLNSNFFRTLTETPTTRVQLYVNNTIQGSSSAHADSIVDNLPKFESPPQYSLYKHRLDSKQWNIDYKRVAPEITLVTLVPNDKYIKRKELVLSNLIWVSTLSALVAIILGLVFSRHITMPVRKVLHAINEVESGKLETSLETNSIYEFTELSRGFNSMTATLKTDRDEMRSYVEKITELKEYNETIIDSIGSSLLIVGRGNIIEDANDRLLRQFSLEAESVKGALVNTCFPLIFDSELMDKLTRIRHGKLQEVSEKKIREGENIFEIKIQPLQKRKKNSERQAVVSIDDISKEQELEEKIYQAEKLSSISILSAGVAHEMNNPLTSILSNVQLLIDEAEDNDLKEPLQWIEQETQRMRRIIKDLLDFSAEERDFQKTIRDKDIIEKTIQLLSFSTKKKKDIRYSIDIPDNLPSIYISSDELKQVTFNLVINSIQAMETSGEINISARTYTDNDGQIIDGGDEYVELVFQDTGKGIDESHLKRIYDPFFTTKHSGIGTGIGLSVVYGIINKYQGTVSVDSRIGKGTTFSIVLPTYS